MNAIFLRRLLFLSVLGLILVGCGAAGSSQPTAVPPTNISNQLSWSYDYSSAGFYAAVKNGHYAEQNLNVDLVAGGYVDGHYVDPMEALTSGTNDFSEADSQSFLQARATANRLSPSLRCSSAAPTP